MIVLYEIQDLFETKNFSKIFLKKKQGYWY